MIFLIFTPGGALSEKLFHTSIAMSSNQEKKNKSLRFYSAYLPSFSEKKINFFDKI
jgi:hypothetical protein